MRPHPIVLLSLALGLSACVDPDLRRGRDALGQGRYALAVTHLERAQAKGLAPGHVAKDLASAHRAWALDLLAKGQCDDASPHLDVAAGLTAPLLGDAQGLFDCRARKPMSPKAEYADLKGLYALGDRRLPVLRRLFEVALLLEDHERALHHAPELESRFSFSLDDRRRILPLLLTRGDHADARRQLERIVTAAPGDPLEALKLAELRTATGDGAGARAIYERLILEHPNNPVLLMRYATFLQAAGEHEAARRAINQANTLRGIDLRDDRELRPLRKSKR
ncbi:MAG: hypothetical protein H6702_01640 [Myxococcales bacterium]|nr:hypothetical protein [Myxococcales bacterium]